MFWIVIGFMGLAAAFLSLSKAWDMRHDTIPLRETPKISILVPAFRSEKTISKCLQSIKDHDYPKKEVIVVNDYPDKTPEITRKFGFKIINNTKRQGKAKSLNDAVKKATGEVLFFMDSDTVIRKDAMKKIVPWLSGKDIVAVAPQYIAENRKSLVPRLVSLENSYNSTMFKMHMLFGSMVSFRGCGVAIKRDFFRKMKGWSHTLIEDTDFAAKTLHAGKKIMYEPKAIVETTEPESFAEMKKQKLRWGRGAGFAIVNNRKAYAGNLQALLQFLPYVIINIIILGYFVLNMFPLSLYFLLNFLVTMFAAVTIHNFIIMFPEKRAWSDIIYMPIYTLTYLPLVLVCYVGGIFLGARDRIKHKDELNLKHW
jgi:cellulose synthase/poly-beta-1,6-N-acetylglucosamine synthase-like glycosyltransferase